MQLWNVQSNIQQSGKWRRFDATITINLTSKQCVQQHYIEGTRDTTNMLHSHTQNFTVKNKGLVIPSRKSKVTPDQQRAVVLVLPRRKGTSDSPSRQIYTLLKETIPDTDSQIYSLLSNFDSTEDLSLFENNRRFYRSRVKCFINCYNLIQRRR